MTTAALRAHRRGVGLAVLLAGAFMALLDVFIVYVATPSIGRDLDASSAQLEWIVAGYGLTFALALITGGRLGDLYGRRRVFQLGLLVFALGSGLCGAAPTPDALIGARLLQGLGAAAMIPQVLSIIQVEYAPHERGRALGVMSAVQGSAAIGGQLAGGLLIQLDVLGLGWRTVFLVNVPIALVAAALAGRLVRESRAEHRRRLDLGGVGLALLALSALGVALTGTIFFTALGSATGLASYGDALAAGATFVAGVMLLDAILCARLTRPLSATQRRLFRFGDIPAK